MTKNKKDLNCGNTEEKRKTTFPIELTYILKRKVLITD